MKLSFCFASIVLLFLVSCKKELPTEPSIVIPSDSDSIIFSKHIQPILKQSCAGIGCHINGEKFNGVSLDSWQDIFNGSKLGAIVVPFSGKKSLLLSIINSDTLFAPVSTPSMPFGRNKLPLSYIKTIKRWIDEGAKNDNSEINLDSPNRQRIFLTSQSEDKVSVIDLEKKLLTRFITVGNRDDNTTPPEAPHNIALSPDKKYFYVNLIASGYIEKYSTETYKKLGELRVGSSPSQIILTKNGENLFVSNFNTNEKFIFMVNTKNMTVIRTIEEVGRGSHSLVLSQDEKFLYSANAYGDEISEIDLTTFEVTRRLSIIPNSPLAPNGVATVEPYHLILSKNGRTIYVSCRKHSEVRVIDIPKWQVIDSIKVGNRPLIIAFTPNEDEIWVPNQADNSLSIINILNSKVTQTISGFKSQPHAIAFNQNSSKAYVTCENQKDPELHHPIIGNSTVSGLVYEVNVLTKSINSNIEVGGFAAGIVIKE